MHITSLVPLAAASLATAGAVPHSSSPFSTLVTFGDSYTDDGRLTWYFDHDDQPPPAGTIQPQENVSASGGLAWGQFVQRDTGATYLDYAVSGATCSNEIIQRYLSSLNGPFPSVVDDELPSFVADYNTSLYANSTPANTVYALWIGTNDLGYGAFLTDSQAPGTNITTYIDCVWSVFDTIYSTGGRRFVLLNTAPLQYAPMYAPQDKGGAGDNQYWLNKTLYNETEYQYKILEYTQLVNRIFSYGAAYEMIVERRWPEATFDVFDVHKLMTDIILDPTGYLEAPANVTGFYNHCVATNNSICTTEAEPLDTFFWYDELHPANKTSSIIAKEFISVVKGESAYGKRFER